MKICALISSHSNPVFTKLTVASLLKNVGQNHQVSIHIGAHKNYSDYSQDFSMFRELSDICHFHLVDEIDWMAHNTDIYRYSRMHGKNLENLFNQVKYFDFDCLLVLDNDLHIKDDFVTKYFDGEDIVGSLFEDNDKVNTVIDTYGNPIEFMPKLSVWNIMISRNMYDFIMKHPEIVSPDIVKGVQVNMDTPNPVLFDTFSKVYFLSTQWKHNVKILPTAELSNSITHFFGSSFNYGDKFRVPKDQQAIIDQVTSIYKDQGYEDFLKNYINNC
jgi:hypothetical protein